MHDLNLLSYLGLFFLISQIFGKIAELLKAPHLIGYLLAGILFGPYVLNVFSNELVQRMDLFRDIALSIIAFTIGSSLKWRDVLKNKNIILSITIFQAFIIVLLVGGAVFVALYFLYASKSINNILAISLLTGAISVATAPATIVSLISEYKARGNLTNIVLGVTALDDAITLIFYSFAFSVAMVLITGAEFNLFSGIIDPFLNILYAIGIGLATGFIIRFILRYYTSESILLGLLLGAVFIIAGLAKWLNLSHLLPIMVFAFYIENFSDSNIAKKLHKSINIIEAPVLGVFFLLAGAHLNITHALSAGIFALVVFFVRIAAKYSGTWLAANATGAETNVKKYAGLALMPSAGVAIGLVLDAQNVLSQHIPDLTDLLLGMILGQTLINELVSPFLVRYVLKKSGETNQSSNST